MASVASIAHTLRELSLAAPPSTESKDSKEDRTVPPFVTPTRTRGVTSKFIKNQKNAERVIDARATKGGIVQRLFQKANVSYPAQQLYIRFLKKDKVLEVWAGDHGNKLAPITSYHVYKASGVLGPKRAQGDLQVPEGFYTQKDADVNNREGYFNENSDHHLSFSTNYPNPSDKILGDKDDPGDKIYLHGGSASIGCIAIEDEWIKELYLISLDTYMTGNTVNIHSFPSYMEDFDMEDLKKEAGDDTELYKFWEKMLKPGYDYFEKHREIPKIDIDPTTGAYSVRPRK